jgi:hypothetical protein
METVQITDLYQASYYILNGCELVGVECIPTGNSTSCQIGVRGSNLAGLEESWFGKKAAANLWAFRNAYSQINSHVQQAKRSFEFGRRQGGRV